MNEAPAAGNVTRSAAWRALESAGTEVISFAIFALMTRLLAPEQFGIVAICSSVIVLLSCLINHGLPEALIQPESVSDSQVRSAFAASLGIGVLLTVVACVLVWPIAMLLSRPALPPIFAAMAPVLIVHGLSAPMHAVLRRRMQFRSIAIRTLAGSMVGGACGLLLASHGFGVWALVAQQWIGALVGMLILTAASPVKPWAMRFDRQALAPLWAVARPVMLGQFVSNSARRLDTVILGAVLSDHHVGIYFLASRLIHSVQMVTQYSIGEVAFVALARLQGNPVLHREGIRRALRLTAYACLLCFGGLALVAPDLIPLLFGPTWNEAVEPLQWLCAFAVCGALIGSCGPILVSGAMAREASAVAIGAAVLQVVMIALTARFGLVPMTIAIGVSQLVALMPALMLVCRHYAIAPATVFGDLMPIVVCSILAFAVSIRITEGHTLLGMIEVGGAFGAIMIAGGVLFFRHELRVLLGGRKRIA